MGKIFFKLIGKNYVTKKLFSYFKKVSDYEQFFPSNILLRLSLFVHLENKHGQHLKVDNEGLGSSPSG